MAFGKNRNNRQWSEYFIEFVMLFLAVTLGFIAENIRENISEENSRKELLAAVVSDFEMDIAQMEFHKDFCRNKILAADSLREITLLESSKIEQSSYYRLLLGFPVYWFFISTDRSRNEADAKGLFLSTKNKELARAIERYAFYYNDTKSLDAFFLKMNEQFLLNTIREITEESLYNKQWRFPSPPDLPIRFGVKPIDPTAKKAFLYHITNVRVVSQTYLYNFDSLQHYARKSVALLNEEIKK
jgi:hypothetical protein